MIHLLIRVLVDTALFQRASAGTSGEVPAPLVTCRQSGEGRLWEDDCFRGEAQGPREDKRALRSRPQRSSAEGAPCGVSTLRGRPNGEWMELPFRSASSNQRTRRLIALGEATWLLLAELAQVGGAAIGRAGHV